jgi:hypothetical protein
MAGYEGIDSTGRLVNPRGKQRPSRFKLLLMLFIFFAVLIFMFAVLSQPIAIIGDVLDDAYPEGDEYAAGRETNSNMQVMIGLALGAAVIVGLIFLFAFYGFRNLGGNKPGSFG